MLPLVLLLASFPLTSTVLQGQQPHARLDWPCGARLDPAYGRVAEASGGHVWLLHPSEVGNSAAVMLGPLQHEETLFRTTGTLADGVHEFSFPVDDSVESVFLGLSLQCLQVVEIWGPSGREVRDGDTGVVEHAFEAVRAVTIHRPERGTWRVHVSGRGLLFLAARGRGDISLEHVGFVRRGGRPGHEGLFPIDEPPTIGTPHLLRLTVSGTATDIRARLVTAAFQDLATLPLLPLAAASADEREQTFVAEMVPPNEPFRIAVSGRDGRGQPFQRVDDPLYEARTAAPRPQ